MKTQPMFNIFSRDIDRQVEFYKSLLDWREVEEASSPIYRVLEGDGIQLGFNGLRAYELLGFAERKPASDDAKSISTAIAFIVDKPETVERVAAEVEKLGGKIVQGPFATYYGHWQLVFEDPERNIARVSSTTLPAEVVASTVEF